MQPPTMYRYSQYVLGVSILLNIIHYSRGLQCVQCHSLHHSEVCEDPFDMSAFETLVEEGNDTITDYSRTATEMGLVTCEQGVTRCMKTTTLRKAVSRETHVREIVVKFVSRECGDSGNEDTCEVFDSGSTKSTICSCLGDRCNVGIMASPLHLLYVTCILSAFYVISIIS